MYLRDVLALALAGAALGSAQTPTAQQTSIPCDARDRKAAARQLRAETASDDCRLQSIARLTEAADAESVAALVSAIDWKPTPPPKKGPPEFATFGGKRKSPFTSPVAEAVLSIAHNNPQLVILALRSLFRQDVLSPDALRNASLVLLFINQDQDEAIRLLKTEAASARAPERRIALEDQARWLADRCSERYSSRCHAAMTGEPR